ncbi:Hox cluster protein ShxA [Operophtera brumata]|uniref:Hox cluster protein ShxA n=1 Tax=Operophtera brumata TaxID=104452 RepID=A0A0L7LJX7_OPEBR|nr:Hox cluster protein ShxA [Operophtera brumata]
MPPPPPPCPRNVVTNLYDAVNIPQNMSNIPMMVQRPANGPNMVAWTNQAWKIKTNVVKKHKRTRTAFTSNQLMELEHEYAKARYLDRNRRIELADQIRLNERTIKIWFQNRRMKEKKDRAESIEELDEVTLTGSPELVIPMPVQEQFPSNEMFHPQGVFIEHYPVSTTSMPVPQVAAPDNYLPYNQDHPYNQGHFQEQHQYSSSYSGEDQELSPDSTAHTESSVLNTQGNMNESNWDFSWLRSVKDEEE